MLGIIWVVFGYFTLMDLGLGRATTKFLAEWLAKEDAGRISDMVWSSIILQVLFGLAGGAIVAILTPVLVERVLKTPASLVGEARTAFYILAAALPTILAANGLRAVLEGCQRFDITNLLRIPSSILAFVIPAIAIAAGLRLPGVVLWMGISRVGLTFAHGFYCVRVLPFLRTRPRIRSNVVFPLLSFGGWVTAANAVNPFLLSMDRFLIGSLRGVALVGYYTAPFEAVTKLWMIPASLMSTVYPACSALGTERMRELQTLYSRSIKYIFCVLAPVSLILVLFAHPIIGAWLGPGFVAKSAPALQFLAVGVFVNCFAHVPYCFLQSLGRPDTTAKLFVLELIPYGLLAWWMIERQGIAGAAAAWSIRAAIEVAFLLWIARRVFSLSAVRAIDHRMRRALGALMVMGTATYVTNLILHDAMVADVSVCAVWVAGFASVVWGLVLDGADRASVLGMIGPLRSLLGKTIGSEKGASTREAIGGAMRRDVVKVQAVREESTPGIAGAAPELELTGERIVPGKTPEALFREHEERYTFAGQYVSGKDVLDVACGSGIGTSFLRGAGARSVCGLDIDQDAVAFAKARYGDCIFAQSDATDLCLANSSVDVVVSFETLEHLEDQRRFLTECHRVLRSGGMLICSTPNATVYRWYGMNPYHVREHTRRGFSRLLAEHFVGLTLFSQREQVYPLFVLRRVVSRSLERLRLAGPIKRILGMKEPPLQMREEFSRDGRGVIREIQRYRGTWLKQPVYLVAVCRRNLD
jgi:O-antigen/teichoic acid export membrane protein/2-polyprenyl-3-methyl-5-hydroxy-6-metoxy-1,4-benzoquinol methylase